MPGRQLSEACCPPHLYLVALLHVGDIPFVDDTTVAWILSWERFTQGGRFLLWRYLSTGKLFSQGLLDVDKMIEILEQALVDAPHTPVLGLTRQHSLCHYRGQSS